MISQPEEGLPQRVRLYQRKTNTKEYKQGYSVPGERGTMTLGDGVSLQTRPQNQVPVSAGRCPYFWRVGMSLPQTHSRGKGEVTGYELQSGCELATVVSKHPPGSLTSL